MSLLYLKSEEFIEDVNSNRISASSQFPYSFRNTFRDPIKVTKDSKIELISADLNVAAQHVTSEENMNNNYTFATGRDDDGFLQKVVKLPDGNYSDNSLAAEMSNKAEAINNVDGAEVGFIFDKIDKFKFIGDISFDKGRWNNNNTFINLNEKIGLNPSIAEQNAGVGSYDTTFQIKNENGIQESHTILDSKNIQEMTETNSTEGFKPPNLISNLVTAKDHGIYNGCGVVCAIVSPLKFVKFNAGTFFTNSTGKKFQYTLNGADQGSPLALAGYTGANNYDFMLPHGATGMNLAYIKIIETQTELDTYTMPNSMTTKNLPYGHFLILNLSDVPINTTIASNELVYMLDTQTDEYFWNFFSASSAGNTASTIKCSDDTAYIKAQATETKLGNWGSASLSLSRGETCLLEANTGLTNQVNNTNRFTRTRIVNTAASGGGVTNRNDIYADYTIQITPTSDGQFNHVLMNYGTQDTSKVAGDTDWLTITSQAPSNDNMINNIFSRGALTTDDNLILVACMTEWLCCRFYIGKDTAGNLQFDDLVQIGNTEDNLGPHAIQIPMNFNESSYPILPAFGTQTPFLGLAEQQHMIFGKYSQKEAKTQNLSALNAYMNTNWGNSQTIPTRQPKQTTTDYCALQDSEELKITIEPNGFNGKTTDGFVEIPDGAIAEFSAIHVAPHFLLRLGGALDPVKDKVFYEEVTDNGWLIDPNENTSLNLNLGFPKVVTFLDYDEPLIFSSNSLPVHDKGQNFIVNLDNFGRLQGQNSATGSISQMVGVIPQGELTDIQLSNDKHYKAPYPIQVDINAKGDELINNFNVYITNDDGTPAVSLQHPTNLFLKITK